MAIVIHSKKSVSVKLSKEVVSYECNAKNDLIGLPESDRKSDTDS